MWNLFLFGTYCTKVTLFKVLLNTVSFGGADGLLLRYTPFTEMTSLTQAMCTDR